MEAGFDGVELHGANGYLIGQFLADSANHREDRYGGSTANRIRFAVEATTAAVEAIGGSRVGIRLSPGAGIWGARETDPETIYPALLQELARLDLAYVHLEATTDAALLLELRRTWPGTLVMNPAFPMGPVATDRESADRWLARGADLISFGRAFIGNPDLVERLRAGLPLADHDRSVWYGGGDEGYVDFPTAA